MKTVRGPTFPESWQDFEGAVETLLKGMVKTHPALYQRFYDTKSAGNFLPKQPADFGVLYAGQWSFLEAKHSTKSKSLRGCFSSAVSSDQLASARLAERAGGPYFFLFASSVTRQYEVWSGVYCYGCRNLSKPLNLDDRLLLTDSLEDAIMFCVVPKISETQS